MTICNFCNEEIPKNEKINIHTNKKTGEQKKYCNLCCEWAEAWVKITEK